MEYTLENNISKLVVDTYACEIHSFKRKDKDFEYMWQGDPEYWKGRNPILFPHVLAPKNKVLNIGGKDYKVGNHGFLRRSEFKLDRKSDDELQFSFQSNEDTLKEYPFDFEIKVIYKLVDNKVFINYEIINNNDQEMPFGFGLHPAFNCPIDPDRKFNDYQVKFNKDENNIEILDGVLKLNRALFKKFPTYYIYDLRSDSLEYGDGENSVKMNFDKFCMFGLWTCEDKSADYICLEPWLHEIEYEDISTPFEKRDGIRFIKAHDSFKIDYNFEII